MTNFYQVEKEINGTKYVAQFSGISTALKAHDESFDDNGNTSAVKMSEYLFKHVIVEPKNLTADDFETMAEYNEVVRFAREVMQGNFREKKDEGATKKASKE